MNNFSTCAPQNKNFFHKGTIINIVFILCFFLLVLGILMIQLDHNTIVQYILLSDLGLIMLIICILGIKTYIDKPNNYNQL